MTEDKVRFKLHKQLLKSERRDRRRQYFKTALKVTLALALFFSGIFVGAVIAYSPTVKSILNYGEKEEIIKEYFAEYWLYGDKYPDLRTKMSDRAFYGMSNFPEDPYTTYLSKEEAEDFASSINMDFVGIGVSYSLFDKLATVNRVFIDSPAAKAGILPGDIIKTIDGVSIAGLNTQEIRAKVLGEAGTQVVIGINRQGKKLELKVQRGAVDSSVFAYDIKGIPVLELISFGEHTYDACRKYLEKYQDAKQLIIDLRDNTGGYQTAVEQIAGLFIGDHRLVMHTVDKNGVMSDSYSDSKTHFKNFEKLVILTNANTASAAEVLTICLLEQHPGTVTVGTTTYGKGVMQSNFPLADGSYLKITSAKWLSPQEKWINGVGITPTYEVFLHPFNYLNFHDIADQRFKEDEIGEFIYITEQALDFLGYPVERKDGYFDTALTSALKAFAQANDLSYQGVLDKTLYEAILSAAVKEANFNLQKDSQMQKALALCRGER